MESIKCIFCDTVSDQVVIQENGYNGLQCSSCSLIYINPRPKLEEIIDLYGHDQAHASAESHISFSYAKTLYTKHTLKIIKKYAKGALLEIGAGAGYFLKEAKRQNFDVYAIEFNTIQSDYIINTHHIPCETNPLNVLTFQDKIFNVIYHCDVLSHFYNPIEEFKTIHAKLKADGYVVFETGNLGDVKKSYFKYYSKFQYPDHLFFFSEDNIIDLLDLTGFELVKIYRYSILPQLFFRKLIFKLSSFIKPKRIKYNSPKSKELQRVITFHYSKWYYTLRQKLKNFYAYLYYVMRYKAGFFVPKKGRPQTMIIVARKRSI